MIQPSPFSQIPQPGKSCGASPSFWQGIAGHPHVLLALMLAQLGGIFTTKYQWQQVSVGFSGDGITALTSVVYTLGTFCAFMLTCFQGCDTYCTTAMPVVSQEDVMQSRTIRSCNFFYIQKAETLPVPLLPSRFLQSVTTFVSCLTKAGLFFQVWRFLLLACMPQGPI